MSSNTAKQGPDLPPLAVAKKKGTHISAAAKAKGMSTVAREIDAYKEQLLDKSQKRLLTSQVRR